MQVEEFLEYSAQRFPDKVALVCGGERLTYREIDRESNRLAHALQDAGVQRGDRVAVFLPNCVEAVLSIFAILKAGAVFVVLNSTTKTDKLSWILNHCRATALLTSGVKAGFAPAVWANLPHLQSVFLAGATADQAITIPDAGKNFYRIEEIRARNGVDSCPKKISIDIDLAALIYTSGSTGRPKGVMMTHLNIVSAATSITTYLENTSSDVVVNFLPLAFDYGLYQLLMTFKVGGTLLLYDSFAFPSVVLLGMEREGVTGFPIVPTVAALLLQMDLSPYSFPRLRYISNTAAALPLEHIRRLRELFPQARLYSMYGLTECKRVSYLPPEQLDLRPASVGRGMPNEEGILGTAGRDRPLPQARTLAWRARAVQRRSLPSR